MLKPISASRWDFALGAHLLNRAGFGGPPAQIHKLVELGPEQAVSHLLEYERIPDPAPDPDWARPDPERQQMLAALRQASEEERRQMQREEQRLQRERLLELRGWWLQRMAKGPRPFQEKMTLFWHGHFATSVQKVRDVYYMWRQNDLFRRLATGSWLRLLIETAKDPAMLIWLDQAQSRRQQPNENFAREVMELFALGEGHYTEKDVTEAARAFTGWSLNRPTQSFVHRPRQHDDGEKTVLGRTGNLSGEQVLEQIVAHPQAATFICGKLWEFFAGEPPSDELNAALTAEFRRAGSEFKTLLKTMFLSEAFYAPALIRCQVKSPVQWLVGSVRMLECELPPPAVCVNLLRNLGQELFAPPNVKGWDGGLAWITTNTLLARYNHATALARGDEPTPDARGDRAAQTRVRPRASRDTRPGGVNVGKILTDAERSDKEQLLAALERRLLQSSLKEKQRESLRAYLKAKEDLDESEIRSAIRLIMSTPEFQLT